MAGHFVLTSISYSDLTVAQQKGCAWSGLAHGPGAQNAPGHPPHTGWNVATRQNLTLALGPVGVPNRNLLPPHRYLTFGPFAGAADPVRQYVSVAGWGEKVIRPNMGLAALCPAAAALWLAGDRQGAIVAQGDHGGTSVEVYYIGGTDIG